jgi:protein CpxP
MKKLILTMAIAAMGFTATFAQDTTKRVRKQMPKLTIEQRAEKATASIDKKLNFTADQKAKFYQLQLDRAKKFEALKTADDAKKKDRFKTFKAESEAYNKEVDAILTPEQKTKFEAMKAEMKNKFKDGKHGGMRRGGKDKAPLISNPPKQG